MKINTLFLASENKKKSSKSTSSTCAIVGSMLGGLTLLCLLLFLVLWCWNYKKQGKMREMERAGESQEALRIAQVEETREPTAIMTRRQPVI
ncbi:unnamed protein product [Brassica oleracea var. botrytis]|uniref:Uncharacterized protein n=2 Tax=Brassica oleracea TaxID=3712 RepID=A0A0D2ZSV3_BRAOL|nr:unnamed protein product [Brassica oleracea]